jgi:Putative  PD-(D/E)XK family member, (DUF4420)
MISAIEVLNTKWSEAAHTARSGHEWRGVALSISSPVRLLAAVREPDERIALLVEGPMSTAPSVKLRFETQGLSLTEQRRPFENVFRLAVTLERNEFKDVFEALCADLVLVVSVASTANSAFAAITKRLEAWQACLRLRKGALSREEQIGLLGEIAVLRIFAEVAGYSAAVEAWKGPVDGIHDFVAKGAAVEVKSVLGIGTRLHISHFDQLEFSGLSSLTIGRVRFREGHNGKTLPSHVEAIRRETADASPAAVSELENKLLRAGYLDVDAPLYGTMHFIQEALYCYAVKEHFPRLARAVIPSAIVDGSYTLDEQAISGFRQDSGYLRKILSMNTGVAHG